MPPTPPLAAVEPVAVPSPVRPDRLDSVDTLRGLIMIVMAIDHVRDYFHFGAVQGFDPLDLNTTTPAIFLTRWITHFCAPIFSFLAGTGVFLALGRGKTKRELSSFLVTRGLWLIALELTVFTWFGWMFAVDPTHLVLATLWALGTSMIALAVMIHWPLWTLLAASLALVAGHNALDHLSPAQWGSWAPLWQVAHAGGRFQIGALHVWAFYPLIPWLGVMPLGYAFGHVLQGDAPRRRRRLVLLGGSLTAAFLLLRAVNIYGDLHRWSVQRDGVRTMLSFLDVTKYPPSLCYLMMTLGPAMLVLAWLDRGTPSYLKPIRIFGRVPMFFYLLHVPLIHALAFAGNFARFGHAEWTYGANPPNPPPNAGWSLPLVYLVWLTLVVALYPLCVWFADVKRRRRDAWLTYF